MLSGKRVLVTGGTGSLGKTVVRRLLTGEMGELERLTIFSRDEAKQNDMRLEYLNRGAATDDVIYQSSRRLLSFRIGDVRDYDALAQAVLEADVVVHAAALKQVPSCEYFPAEAVKTNLNGAINLVRAVTQTNAKVELVVGISTDKACKPVNVMGIPRPSWSGSSSRRTSRRRARASSACAMATSSPRAAPSCRSSSTRSRRAGP